jgi:hypothetical protein
LEDCDFKKEFFYKINHMTTTKFATALLKQWQSTHLQLSILNFQ